MWQLVKDGECGMCHLLCNHTYTTLQLFVQASNKQLSNSQAPQLHCVNLYLHLGQVVPDQVFCVTKVEHQGAGNVV